MRYQKHQGERGIALLMSVMMCMALVPLIGLGIDGSIVYMMRAKISRAADAAALAGARALSRGDDEGSQSAAAIQAAQNYLNANLTQDDWGATLNTPAITITDDNLNHLRRVAVTASLDVPLYFLRVLNHDTAHISLTAQAVRRDVNVVLVLDHSGSMLNAMGAMHAAANGFVNAFAAGRDNLGLVVFGGQYYLAYPASPNFKSSGGVAGMINNLQSNGSTGTAQAIWKAYGELQRLNQTGALNVIVLFTDGLANAITADFQPYLSAGSGCTNSAPKIAFLTVLGNSPSNYSIYGGLDPVSTSLGDIGEFRPALNTEGCNWLPGNSANAYDVSSALTQIPPYDYYGNSTNGQGTMPAYKSVDPSLTSPDVFDSITHAGENALDDAANRIRSDTALTPVIYVIGLGGNPGAPPDNYLMARVANQAGTPDFNSNQPAGVFAFSPSTAQLQAAFQQIASEIIRLTL